MAKAKRIMATFGKVISLLLVGIILLTMFAGCSTKTSFERFEDLRSNEAVATVASAGILKMKLIHVLHEDGVVVEDSYISACFIDNIPYITFVALVTEEGGSVELKKYSIQTEYNGPIVSCFNANSEKISVYGEMLHIDEYFENADYSIHGEKIVVK